MARFSRPKTYTVKYIGWSRYRLSVRRLQERRKAVNDFTIGRVMVPVVYNADLPDPQTGLYKAYFQPYEYFAHMPSQVIAALNRQFLREHGETPLHVKGFKDEMENCY